MDEEKGGRSAAERGGCKIHTRIKDARCLFTQPIASLLLSRHLLTVRAGLDGWRVGNFSSRSLHSQRRIQNSSARREINEEGGASFTLRCGGGGGGEGEGKRSCWQVCAGAVDAEGEEKLLEYSTRAYISSIYLLKLGYTCTA